MYSHIHAWICEYTHNYIHCIILYALTFSAEVRNTCSPPYAAALGPHKVCWTPSSFFNSNFSFRKCRVLKYRPRWHVTQNISWFISVCTEFFPGSSRFTLNFSWIIWIWIMNMMLWLRWQILVIYAFFWVIPRRLKFICRRFGTLCSIFIGRKMWVEFYSDLTAYEDRTSRVFRNVGI